jgi:hypothetical protein
MTDAPEYPEPPPAAEAPAIIITPPPAPERPWISGSEKRKRQHVRRCRFDDDELAEFDRRARERKLSHGAFIRLATLGTPGPRSQRNQPTEQSRLTVANHIAVNRVGANVNQGIRALNEIALKAPEVRSRDRLADEVMATREMLRASLATLDDTLATLRAALGFNP